MTKLITLLLSILLLGKANAQLPILETLEDNKFSQSTDVAIQSLNIDVSIFENISITTMEITVVNNSDRIREGKLTFPLPDGASINGFALDINGHLRDAVPVEKEKGTAIFEDIEYRKIDPGLLEKTTGNNFRTRIYPILPNGGTRTVKIIFQKNLESNNGAIKYYLPLDHKQYKDFSLVVKIVNSETIPVFEDSPAKALSFEKNLSQYNAQIKKQDFIPKGDVAILIPINNLPHDALMQKEDDSSYYFITTVKIPKHDSIVKAQPKTIGIIWDNSLSRNQINIKKEIEFLKEYLGSFSSINVELATLSTQLNIITKLKIKKGEISDLEKIIRNITYDGGTDYSVLEKMNVDEYLFFTDGLTNFGEPGAPLQKPVHTITTSTEADFALMKNLSTQTGGYFINLNTLQTNEAIKMLSQQPYRLINIDRHTGQAEIYPRTEECFGDYMTIVGKTNKKSDQIHLNFGYNNKADQSVAIKLEAGNVNNAIKIDNYFAQKKIENLDINYNKNQKEITELGKKYGIVTRNTSLIVLESIQDYIKYELPPPAELKEEYDNIVSEQKEEKAEEISDLMDNAQETIESLKDWYQTDFIAVAEKERIDSIKRVTAKHIADSIYTANQKRVADSIHTADSIRIAYAKRVTDSIRVTDSLKQLAIKNGPQIMKDSIPFTIRGLSSINASNRPLVVVNGVLYDGDISALNKNDIKTMTILRDTASTSLYGARGTNGVIIINTSPSESSSNNSRSDSTALSEVVITAYSAPIVKQQYTSSTNMASSRQIASAPISEMYSSESAAPGVQTNDRYDATINVFHVSNNTDYIKALASSTTTQLAYKTYLELREKYYYTPTFYLDVANWFLDRNEIEKGIRILSNLAELNLQNAEIYKAIAYMLKKYNQTDKLLYITGKIMQWRPMDPQSYRDYALALADKGYYQLSLQYLYNSLLEDYTDKVLDRDEGIEETILMDINNLISKHEDSLITEGIDTSLITDIPVDIRVVLNWNMEDVDMDLHIIDPNNEECFYDHNMTRIGGRLSEDFTEGFGPEQFLLKKAIKGKYKIKTKYFDENRVTGGIKTTLMAEVFLYYGTNHEQRKIIVFQSDKSGNNNNEEDSDNILVGEFDFR